METYKIEKVTRDRKSGKESSTILKTFKAAREHEAKQILLQTANREANPKQKPAGEMFYLDAEKIERIKQGFIQREKDWNEGIEPPQTVVQTWLNKVLSEYAGAGYYVINKDIWNKPWIDDNKPYFIPVHCWTDKSITRNNETYYLRESETTP